MSLRKRILCGVFSLGLAVAWLILAIEIMQAGQAVNAQIAPQASPISYHPLVLRYYPSPAGSYICDEYEFGLIWLTEVITLNADGSSVYYGAADDQTRSESMVVTGTWVYTPTASQVGFTNFRWLTATYESPDRLWASDYLEPIGFEIAIECDRR
jgi:hypothetical protein